MKQMLLLLLILSLLLCGCGREAAAPETEGFTFTDDLGRTVTVSQPQRVAVLIGSFADIWCLAGGADSLVATANDAWTSFDGLPLENVINLGATKDINLELLIAAQPDFIIASCNTALNLELELIFTEMGILAAYFQVSTFSEYLHMLDICTQITGNRQAYTTYGTDIQAHVNSAISRADGRAPSVLYIRATSSGCKVKNSEGSVLGEMLADLGCANIADSNSGLLENLSIEAILAADPDAIFLVYQSTDPAVAEETFRQTLGSDPAWATLRAVKEGRVYIMDQKLYNLKPNEKWGEAYEKLADILYPAA